MRIAVLGWYGNSNIGDEAYKLAFPKLFPQHTLTFTNKLTKDLNADAIILGGGDILYTDFPRQLIPHTIPKYALSVSIMDKKSLPAINFRRIITRDNLPGYEWLPDFTFVLSPDIANGKALVKQIFASQQAELYDKICVVVINSHLMAGEATLARDSATFEKFSYDMARLMDETLASFLFLPFGNGFPHNDRITNSMIYSKCKFSKKNAIVYEIYTPQETLDIISAVNMTISSRLHSSIFSCIGGTPFIDVTHHDKNRSFLKTINKENWSVNYWRFCYSTCKELADEFLNVNPYRKELLVISQAYKGLLANAKIL